VRDALPSIASASDCSEGMSVASVSASTPSGMDGGAEGTSTNTRSVPLADDAACREVEDSSDDDRLDPDDAAALAAAAADEDDCALETA